jgi:5-methylcytosine-specific restriction protein B
MEKNHIRIGYDQLGELSEDFQFDGKPGSHVVYRFHNRMQIGDIVFSCYSSRTIDAIGVITGEAEWRDAYPKYKRLRKVKWLVQGINEDIVDLNGGNQMTLASVYKLSVSASDAMQLLKKTKPQLFAPTVKIPNRVFIIDEINRGNISKIFGELITLIEPSKRIGSSEGLRVLLPYSGKSFGIPDNVYVIGTMNTADRSIAMIDTALRRRFDFLEMQPDSKLLRDVVVDGIDIAEMLDTMNNRITALLDREHTIGHSYLLSLKEDPSVQELARIFENKIIPLLQEYFYDDYEKIQLVLGDNQKSDSDDSKRFIVKESAGDVARLFGNADINYSKVYKVNREALRKIEAYEYLN